MTDLHPFPERVIHCGRASASSCNLYYIIIFWRSSSNCLSLLPRLSVPSIFSSTTCFIRQFLRQMWQIPLAFQVFVICKKLLSYLTLYNIHCWYDQHRWYPPFFSSSTFQNFSFISDLLSTVSKIQHHTKLFSKCSILLVSSLHFSQFAGEKNCYFMNVAFAMANLDLNLLVNLVSFIMLTKSLKYSTFWSCV
jgi:hypothetical protein